MNIATHRNTEIKFGVDLMSATKHGHTCSGMLYQILSSEDYSIALTPGFFRFYALIGVLQALEEKGCLRPSHVTGASAGALVGGFLAAGKFFLPFPVLATTVFD